MRLSTLITALMCIGLISAAHMRPAMAQQVLVTSGGNQAYSPTPEMVYQCTDTIVRVYTSANSRIELEKSLQDVQTWCLFNFEHNIALTEYQKAGCDKIQQRFDSVEPKIVNTHVAGKTVAILNPDLVIPPSACKLYEQKKLHDRKIVPNAQVVTSPKNQT
jgi:hypothetical protein